MAFYKQSKIKEIMPFMLALGFASGLPLALTGSTLQAWYASDGIAIASIGFLTLIELPYLFKFLWAPFFDRFQLPFLDSRRAFVAVTQVLLAVVMILMGFFSPTSTPVLLALLAVFLAFLSASQDISFDAYRTEILKVEERGIGTFWSVSGYRIAMLVSGGLALVMADVWGFSVVFFVMAFIMMFAVWVTIKSPTLKKHSRPSTLREAFFQPVSDLFARKNMIAILFLVMTFKLGDAFLGSLSTAFLIRDVGISLSMIGTINKVAGLFASLLGVYLGGLAIYYWRFNQVLLIALLLQISSNFGYWFLSVGYSTTEMVWLVLILEQLAGGVGTAALIALVMALCNKKYVAMQFAIVTSLAGLGRVVVGPMAGQLVEQHGWSAFILVSIPVGMIALMFLKLAWNGISELSNQEQEELIPEAILEGAE